MTADLMAPDPTDSMETGRVYTIAYECRDIGYGVESGFGEFIYRGGPDWTGKHTFAPTNGQDPIYLFPDEIKDLY